MSEDDIHPQMNFRATSGCRDFPEIRSEPTSLIRDVAERTPCPECGEDAWTVERNGGIEYPICRECRIGKVMLMRYANYGADWHDVREWVLKRDGHQCWECGSAERLQVHHVEKMIWFETTAQAHRPENLVTLCESCHQSLEDQIELFSEVGVA
jgi:5-methylcytosine-specific restriction endonuclease McrA